MKISTIWLAPLGFLYLIATRFRNYLYNIGYSRSFNYDIMVIAVGNLSAGGTGKSPMTEYLIRLLHKQFTVATLSRGYKRKTRGFLFADEYTGVDEVGDEPYQMYLKYGKVARIAVGEERSIAIPNILLEHPETQVILMDDGYQHRSVRPDFSVLLTDYHAPFYKDHMLPWGRLREAKVGARRANAVIVTKCPETMTADEENEITNRIRKHAGADMPVYFSQIVYTKPRVLHGNFDHPQKVIAFAGLANTGVFEEYLSSKFELVEMISFNDHHNYTANDIRKLVNKAKSAQASLITTEKDIVKFRNKEKIKLLEDTPLFYLSIKHRFVKNGSVFDKLVEDAIAEKYKEEE
ncbi:MAG: tetraacyldisaccharide 4'-kinase [Bacteroidota bacterium]